MRKPLTHVITMAAIGTFIALATGPAAAKTTKECDEEYALRKGVVEAAKEKKADFMAECRTLGSGEPTPIVVSAPHGSGD
jgi:hypothetical protein